MPGMKFGQIYSYPQRSWRKKKYQYLEHFMKPVNQAFEPESEMHTISQIENPAAEKPVVSSTSTNSTTTNSTGKNFHLFAVHLCLQFVSVNMAPLPNKPYVNGVTLSDHNHD